MTTSEEELRRIIREEVASLLSSMAVSVVDTATQLGRYGLAVIEARAIAALPGHEALGQRIELRVADAERLELEETLASVRRRLEYLNPEKGGGT